MKINEEVGIQTLLQRNEASRDEYQKLIYAVSHDLASPIRSVVSFSKLLKKSAEEKLSEKELHYLSFIVENGEKTQNMFLALLEYSRLLTRSGELVRLDLNDIAKQTLELLAKPIADSNAVIKVDKLPNVIAEPNQVARLFFALVDNAVKFRKAGVHTEISISAKRSGRGYQISFEDNGIGIEEKFHESAFDVFKRLNAEKDFPGTGMGLAMAKRIMDLHGGEIWVKSQLGQGAQFICFFPDFNPTI